MLKIYAQGPILAGLAEFSFKARITEVQYAVEFLALKDFNFPSPPAVPAFC